MKISIDFSKGQKTEQQEKHIDKVYEAAKILNHSGFNAEVILCFVTNKNDNPAHIRLDFKSEAEVE